MKKISKITCFLALLTFTVACNDEVEIKEIYTYDLPSFDDIKHSTFRATGTLYPNEAVSWEGNVHPWDDDYGMYYSIEHWYNTEIYIFKENAALWLDYYNGKLVLVDNDKVGEDGDYDLYFGASYYNENGWIAVSDYAVSYNKTTQTLDFSGAYDGYQIYVGIFGRHYITGEEKVYTDTQIKNAKLVLTPYASYSSPLKSAQSAVSETSRKSVSNTGSVNRSEVRSKSIMKDSLIIQSRTSKSVQCLE
jgi:hypothetical protein